MLEMPEMFERHMMIGKQEFEKENYDVAITHFEKAYDLKDDLKANVFLTKSLIAVEKYDEAFQRMLEFKGAYLLNKDYQEIYFELLLQKQYLLEIEKFFMLPSIEVKESWIRKYEVAKDYQMVINETKFKEMSDRFQNIVNIPFWEQKKELSLMKFFSKKEFLAVSEPLLISEQLPVLFRNELINQLVQLKIAEKIEIRTWDNEIKTLIPKNRLSLQQTYQESIVLKEVSQYYSEKNPSLEKEIFQMVKLHIGYLYPFSQEIMVPTTEWVKSYLHPYGSLDILNSDSKTLESVYVYQKKLDKELTKLAIFQ